MYESFYGLTSKPFQLNPDPSFYFGSKQHRRATAYLEYGMHQNEGFIVITGEVGAGKTTIVRGLLDGLDSEKVVAAHLVSTQLDADDTLRLVGAAFGVRTKDVAKSDVLMALEAFLYNFTLKGKRCILIVDEAQNLEPTTLKTILTRIGEGTKVVFTGDTSQIDAPYMGESNNALAVLIHAFAGQRCFGHITLAACERSAVASLAAELL
jgi:predicted ribonuclease YlaK